MFDIRDYLGENNTSLKDERGIAIDEIEDDISKDIDSILKNRFDSLYLKERFKHGSDGVDIVYPRVVFPGNKNIFRGPDHIRYLLSLYPCKSDLGNVEKVVLRPRHVDIGGIELMALYLRQRGIVVLYLHHPHLYVVRGSKFSEYAEHAGLGSASPVADNQSALLRADLKSEKVIPPLWYILSIVSRSAENLIDKFFIRKDPHQGREISRVLDELSFFYSRHGY
jgi:hypothetical protein